MEKGIYQVSGVGFRGLEVGIVLLLGGLSLAGFGQEMKYSFHVGEIIDYDLTTTPINADGIYGKQKTTRKYQFRVDKVSGDQYWLAMRFMGFFSDGLWISDKIASPELEYRSLSRIPGMFNVFFNIEINHPITFSMNSTGKIMEFSGADSVFNAIVQQATKMPDIKRTFSYNRLKARYSKDYYMMIIQEFFPVLTGSLKDTVSLHSGGRTNCRSENDQIVLNELTRNFPYADPEQSMRSTRDNLSYLTKRKHLLSADFMRFMEFENQYTNLSHQVRGFIRTHQSHLVNLNHIQTLVRRDGGYLKMSDGSSVPISRSRKEDLSRRMM